MFQPLISLISVIVKAQYRIVKSTRRDGTKIPKYRAGSSDVVSNNADASKQSLQRNHR